MRNDLHYPRDGSARTWVIGVHLGVDAKVIGQQLGEGNFERSTQAIGQGGCAGLHKPVVLPWRTGDISNHRKLPQSTLAEVLDQFLLVTPFACV